MKGLPTKEIAQKIFDAHLDLIWTAMQGQITDIEQFNTWANKIAAGHTSTTLAFMYPHEVEDVELIDLTKIAQNGTNTDTNQLD